MNTRNIAKFLAIALLFLNCWGAQAQSHHIGEVVTASNGQRGIVFYVSPDDDNDYWLVALNDLPQSYPWGDDSDIADIPNFNTDDAWYALHYEP